MKSAMRGAGRALALMALLFTLPATGCAGDESPEVLVLRGNTVVIRLPGAGSGVSGQCYANQAEFMRPNGTIDLMLNNKYDMFPLMENRLLPTENVSGNKATELRADASLVTITGAEVYMTMDTSSSDSLLEGDKQPVRKYVTTAADLAADAPRSWWVPFVTTIEPRDEAYSRFEALSRNVGNAMRTAWLKSTPPDKFSTMETVTLHVTIEGFMQDGTIVRSQTIPYPLNVCYGCLVYLPTVAPGIGFESEDMQQVCGSKFVVTEYATPCVIGNDEYVPCTYYCYVCEQNKGDFAVPGFDCEKAYCPDPL